MLALFIYSFILCNFSSPYYVDLKKSLSLPKVLSSVDLSCSAVAADTASSTAGVSSLVVGVNKSEPSTASSDAYSTSSSIITTVEYRLNEDNTTNRRKSSSATKKDEICLRNKYVSKSLGDIAANKTVYPYIHSTTTGNYSYAAKRNFSVAVGAKSNINNVFRTVEVFNDIAVSLSHHDDGHQQSQQIQQQENAEQDKSSCSLKLTTSSVVGGEEFDKSACTTAATTPISEYEEDYHCHHHHHLRQNRHHHRCCLSVSETSLSRNNVCRTGGGQAAVSPSSQETVCSRESCCSASYCPKCGARISGNLDSSSSGGSVTTSSCRVLVSSTVSSTVGGGVPTANAGGGSVDEILQREIRELNQLSKYHRLGSVDFEPYRAELGANVVSGEKKIKTLHRFASTGVELGNDHQIDMTLDQCQQHQQQPDHDDSGNYGRPKKSSSSADLLSNHWAPERLVRIYRDNNANLGISIVGGKVYKTKINP